MLSKSEQESLQQQANQMDQQARLQQSYSDDYYGYEDDYRASRRVREFGYSTNGEYWEE